MAFETYWPALQTLLPWLLATLIAVWFARQLPLESGGYLESMGARAESRFRLLVAVVTIGLMARGIDKAAWVVFTLYRVSQLGLPFLQPDAPLGEPVMWFTTLEVVVEPVLWMVAFIAALMLLRRVDWAARAGSVGFEMRAVHLVLAALVLATVGLWPLEVLRAVAYLLLPLATSGSVSQAFQELMGMLPRPAYLLAVLASYGFGAWVAWRFVGRWAGGRASPARLSRLGLWLLSAYLVSAGLNHLSGVLLDSLVGFGLTVGALREGPLDRTGVMKLLQVALPYLAYPLAADVMLPVRKTAVSERLHLPRPRLTWALLYLTAALLLTWPFRMPERFAEIVVPLTSLGAIKSYAIGAVVVVLAWLGYQVRYAGRK